MEKSQEKNYPPESAGRLMIKDVPCLSDAATVADAEKLLFQKIQNFNTINYLYILSQAEKLKGVISVKELFRSPRSTPIKKLLPPETISVHPHTDQERVALLALKNQLKAVPVVDQKNKFLGIITHDTLLNILNSEASEDIFHLGGVTHQSDHDDIFHLSLLTSLWHRLPWLILGLLGGMLAAGVVHLFETVLAQNLILAAFIPLIVYMADAVGTQMEAFIIRDLAFTPKLNFLKYLFRQALIVMLIGIAISALLYLGSLIIYRQNSLSWVLALALILAISSSLVTGLLIPYLFSKLKLDPANASGPIATIIQDILSVLVYFTIASLLL
jgi:magnesium transporter